MAAAPEIRFKVMLALNPYDWRTDDRMRWVQELVEAIELAAPHLWSVESYEVADTVVYVHLVAEETRAGMRKRLREDDALIRLRARLADMGARPEFEVS